MKKLENLKQRINLLIDGGGLCVSFSGGVDSSLLLKIACEEAKKLNNDIFAVTFATKLHPMEDIEVSKKICKEFNILHNIIYVNEFENINILNNPIDRCYYCKKYLFTKLVEFAKSKDIKNVIDGTNADDLKEYRPGILALKELEIISPLAELGITKSEVRTYAKKLNISVSNRPSTPCMATRLPYNTKIDFKTLKKLEDGENYIKNLGFEIIRLRLHNNIIRVEIKKDEFMKFLNCSEEIIKFLKGLGFKYITLDLEGFRSGSMDIDIKKE